MPRRHLHLRSSFQLASGAQASYSADMAHNDAVLDGRYKKPYPEHAAREEPGVSERANQQLSQGDRSFYAGAFDGSTPIGAKKGNRSSEREDPPRSLTGEGPFINLRGSNR